MNIWNVDGWFDIDGDPTNDWAEVEFVTVKREIEGKTVWVPIVPDQFAEEMAKH